MIKTIHLIKDNYSLPKSAEGVLIFEKVVMILCQLSFKQTIMFKRICLSDV